MYHYWQVVGDRVMRITETQVRKNREKVVAKASRLFRERGFDGISVNDLMKAAGFTHGGFYNHFESKEALVAEALHHSFRVMDEVRGGIESLDEFIAAYLSDEAKDAPGLTCPAAALATEVARQTPAIKQVFSEGLERLIVSVERRMPEDSASRSDAVDLVCRMVGALVLARAVPKSSDLGEELLVTATERCRESAADLKKAKRGRRPAGRKS